METLHLTQEQRLENARKKVNAIKGFYTHAFVFVCVSLFIIFSNAVVAGKGFGDLNSYYTAIYWGFGLLAHGLSVFGSEFILGKNWEEKQIEKQLNS